MKYNTHVICSATHVQYGVVYVCFLFLSQMVGFLNVEIWIGVEGILVDDLRLDRKFPDSPVVGWLTVDTHTHTHTHLEP